MTDTIQTLGLVTLAQEFRGDVVRQINRRTILLKLLSIVPGGGKNVAFAPESSGQVAENYSEGADAANYGSDAQASATLNWGLYRAPFHVSNLAMDASVSSSSPVGNHKLWARNLVNASAKLATVLEADGFSGAGTGTLIAGLDVAIGSMSNTYAGIDRSSGSNSYWRPYVVDPGSLTAVTFAQIRTDIAAIYKACGMNPDVALCSPDVFNKVVGLFDATRRVITDVTTARGKVELDMGYQGVEIDGTVFIKAKDATESQIYYLNTNHVRFEYLPPAGVPEELLQMVQADDGYGPVPLGFKYEKLAKTGAAEKAEILSTIQLVVDRPNSCGVRKNVAIA